MKKIVELICPHCNQILNERKSQLHCSICNRSFPIFDGIPSFIESDDGKILKFYDEWHKKAESFWNVRLWGKRKYFFPYKLKDYLKKNIVFRKIILNLCYFEGRKEFFFRNAFKNDPEGLVLDLGCGKGNDVYSIAGSVIGIDLSLYSLLEAKVKSIYQLLVHGDIIKLPFKNEQFDYIVSCDLIEHIPISSKDTFYSEIYRVLKKGGKMVHFVTTDSKNIWFRFAHRYPDLFHKYLIEEIGGHHGLEMPTDLVQRIEKIGFIPLYKKKMLWEPQEFVLRFNNEYKYKSVLVRLWVFICKILIANEVLSIIINIPLGFFTRFIEQIIPFDYSQHICIIYKKQH